MTKTMVVGVDPGLVHTGVVGLVFDPDKTEVRRYAVPVLGPDRAAVSLAIDKMQFGHKIRSADVFTFVEDYKPRSHYNTDSKMTKAVHDMRGLPHAKVISNEGAKKIVKRKLMDLLHVWSFTQVTNHQDLRAAARIALLGMLKDDRLNELLTQVVHDHLAGETWNVLV
jgi:hypothetical protein